LKKIAQLLGFWFIQALSNKFKTQNKP